MLPCTRKQIVKCSLRRSPYRKQRSGVRSRLNLLLDSKLRISKWLFSELEGY
ncbi:hypothetical protein Mapa_014921 [Marchantia paleacea]|nr:hypothetical protein Mapa_014921 [Marchantia paleacea]